MLCAGVADDQFCRGRHAVHGADGGERHVRHGDLDRDRAGPVQIPQGLLARWRKTQRPQIPRAVVPAAAADVHCVVLLAVCVPGAG
ncbi:hypothetical protein D3C85_1666420 [compost metagenome]